MLQGKALPKMCFNAVDYRLGGVDISHLFKVHFCLNIGK